LIFERIQEVEIAVFSVRSHNVQPMITELANLAQLFHLLNSDFQVDLLAGNPLYIYRQ
jgi:hypothetical protein